MIANCAYSAGAKALFFFALLSLGGCGVLQQPVRPLMYDFGPGSVAATKPASTERLPALVVAGVDTTAALDTTSVLYRLTYSDAQQLRPYAQARWSMPPAQLLHQRLRETLGQHRMVLGQGEGVAAGHPSLTLRVVLEEFSQIFESAENSLGLVRLRATLSYPSAGAERVLAQHSFVVQRQAASADAAGGVQALAAATDGVIADLAEWMQRSQPSAGRSSP